MELIVIKPEFRKLFSDEREHVLFLKEKSDFGNNGKIYPKINGREFTSINPIFCDRFIFQSCYCEGKFYTANIGLAYGSNNLCYFMKIHFDNESMKPCFDYDIKSLNGVSVKKMEKAITDNIENIKNMIEFLEKPSKNIGINSFYNHNTR